MFAFAFCFMLQPHFVNVLGEMRRLKLLLVTYHLASASSKHMQPVSIVLAAIIY